MHLVGWLLFVFYHLDPFAGIPSNVPLARGLVVRANHDIFASFDELRVTVTQIILVRRI